MRLLLPHRLDTKSDSVNLLATAQQLLPVALPEVRAFESDWQRSLHHVNLSWSMMLRAH
jgi:hypothetical protein